MEETLKRERRAFYSARRDALSSAERAELSGRLCEIVAQQVVAPLERGSVEPLVVCVYGAFRSETDPSALERWCRERGHLAIAPRILSEGDSRRGDAGMELRIVGSPADWTTGRWNVPEPNPETARPYPADGRIDVVLVPGLAFDENGGRLGYGGGYYDRFYAARRALSPAALGRTLWIGFAYEAQLSEEALPREPHDLPLDGVATELGLRRLNGGMAVESQQKQETGAPDRLTHFNEQGRAAMVDVTDKAVTSRTAVAETRVRMRPETLSRIRERSVAKGDVLAVAQIAGIQAAKRTSDWIPMCHPLPLTGVDIRFEDNGSDTLYIAAEVKTTGKTGVEMEALTAVSAAALTVYDMCKAVQKDMEIGPTRLLSKTGGKSGDYAAPET